MIDDPASHASCIIVQDHMTFEQCCKSLQPHIQRIGNFFFGIRRYPRYIYRFFVPVIKMTIQKANFVFVVDGNHFQPIVFDTEQANRLISHKDRKKYTRLNDRTDARHSPPLVVQEIANSPRCKNAAIWNVVEIDHLHIPVGKKFGPIHRLTTDIRHKKNHSPCYLFVQLCI